MLKKLWDFSDNRKMMIGFCLTIGIVILSMLQDFVHSQVRNYHFYVSESLLYNSFWLLFAPFVLFQIRVSNWFSNSSKVIRVITNLIFVGFFTILHLISFPSIVVGISELFFYHTYRFQNVLDYELSEYLYVCLSVYLSIGVFLIFKPSQKQTTVKNDLKTVENLLIQKGTERITVASDSIYCITSEAPYVAIYTVDKKYLYSDTLTSLLSKLDKRQFVRIHKSTIIHIEKMRSYKSRKNGDYDVLLQNGIKKRISRTYASAFKSRIQ